MESDFEIRASFLLLLSLIVPTGLTVYLLGMLTSYLIWGV